MPRFVALLRGVSPLNCKMPELKSALESAGFTDVKTVLTSGNAVFSAKSGTESALEKKIEAMLKKELGREFPTIVRSVDFLRELIERDPFKRFKPKAGAKCVVTFFKTEPTALQRKVKLPIEQDGARRSGLKGGSYSRPTS